MKISIAVITYNQEAYIAQTLDSIIEQRCSFDFEIVVGEDCSTDGTRRICQKYQSRHPDKIRLLLHEKNQGLVENYYQTLALCRGEYIAQCAGDDYWCDPLKLQKQVDFLDAHPDYALVHGGMRMLKELTGETWDCLPKACTGGLFDALIRRQYIPCAATLCFRRSMFEQVETAEIRSQRFLLEDLPLLVSLSLQGKFHAMPEVVAVYRIVPGSISWPDQVEKKIRFEKSVCDAIIFCAQKYKYGGDSFLRRVRCNCDDKNLKLLIHSGQFTATKSYLKNIPVYEFLRWKVFRAWLVAMVPSLRSVLFK